MVYLNSGAGHGLCLFLCSLTIVPAIAVVAVVTVTASVVMPSVIMAPVVMPSPTVATLPAAATQFPAVASLAPFWSVVHISATRSFPVPASPGMAAAIPVPISGRPHITVAWRRNHLVSWRRWRRTDDDVDANLGHRLCRHQGGDANGDKCDCT